MQLDADWSGPSHFDCNMKEILVEKEKFQTAIGKLLNTPPLRKKDIRVHGNGAGKKTRKTNN